MKRYLLVSVLALRRCQATEVRKSNAPVFLLHRGSPSSFCEVVKSCQLEKRPEKLLPSSNYEQ